MTNDGEKLMKFGPEWLRNNLSRDSVGSSHGGSAATRARATPRYKPAEYKYERQDILDLFDPKLPAPESVKSIKALYVATAQIPEVLQCRSRNIRRAMHTITADFRPQNRGGFRDFNRPVNNFQPRWAIDNNRRQYPMNRPSDGEDNWRAPRQELNRKWNDKPRERRDSHGPVSSSFSEDRNSPDDMLPEWANSEDPLDETGSFDSTGAFLPIVPESKNDNNMESKRDEPRLVTNVPDTNLEPEIVTLINKEDIKQEPEDVEDEQEEDNGEEEQQQQQQQQLQQEEEEKEKEVVDNDDDDDDVVIVSSTIDCKKSPEVDKICEKVEKLGFSEDSIYFMEDYLNKLVQEDDTDTNRSKARSTLVTEDSKAPPLHLIPNQSIFNAPPPSNTQFHNNSTMWYYKDGHDRLLGPFTKAEMNSYFNLNVLQSYTMVRRGHDGPFITMRRFMELCSDNFPFLASDSVVAKIFNVEPPFTYPPGNYIKRMFEPSDSPRNASDQEEEDDEIDPKIEQLSDRDSPVMNFGGEGGSIRIPFIPTPMRGDENPPMVFPPNIPHVENPMMYPMSRYPPQNPDTGPPSIICPQTEQNLSSNWARMNHNMPWLDPPVQPKPSLTPYVPIPMPSSANNQPVAQPQESPMLSRFRENLMAREPMPNIPLMVDNLGSHMPASNPPMSNLSPIWNEPPPQPPMRKSTENFDFSQSGRIDLQKMFQHPMYMPQPNRQMSPVFSGDDNISFPNPEGPPPIDMGIKIEKPNLDVLDDPPRPENELSQILDIFNNMPDELRHRKVNLDPVAMNLLAIENDIFMMQKRQQHLKQQQHIQHQQHIQQQQHIQLQQQRIQQQQQIQQHQRIQQQHLHQHQHIQQQQQIQQQHIQQHHHIHQQQHLQQQHIQHQHIQRHMHQQHHMHQQQMQQQQQQQQQHQQQKQHHIEFGNMPPLHPPPINPQFSWNMKEQVQVPPNYKKLANSQRMEKQQLINAQQQSQQQKMVNNPPNLPINNMPRDKFSWSIPQTSPQPMMSFLDIQAEQLVRQNKAEKPHQNPNVLPSPNFQQSIWSNTQPPKKQYPMPGPSSSSAPGFWDTERNKSKMDKPPPAADEVNVGASCSKVDDNAGTSTSTSTEFTPGVIRTVTRVPLTKGGKWKTLTKEQVAQAKLFFEQNGRSEEMQTFIAWAEVELTTRTEIDQWGDVSQRREVTVSEFVKFLATVDSPADVEEYTKAYLGDTQFTNDFSKVFVNRRSQILYTNANMAPPGEDQSARQPSGGGDPPPETIGESRFRWQFGGHLGKNKKKKGKMSKVDARILGFNTTAAEDRFNIGNIESS